MSLITLGEAKGYLRVDSGMEDDVILSLLASSEKLCADVGRLTAAEWNAVCTDETVTIRGTELDNLETAQVKELLRTAVLFILGYLFEHREEADHHDLVMTLRNLLASVREGVF